MKNTNLKKLLSALFFATLALTANRALAIEVYDTPIVAAPKNISPAKRYPLVLLLHGYMANKDFMNYWTGYGAQVEKRQFVLVIPNGLKDSHGLHYWNASPACCDFDHRNNDDVHYLKSLIDEAITKYPIDKTRIFVVGHSNGAFMAQTMGCTYSDTITGVISFAGELAPKESCNYVKPISMLQIHAEDDKTIHIEGVINGYDTLAAYPSTKKTLQTVFNLDHCKSFRNGGEQFNLASLIPGNDTTKFVADGCDRNVAVEFWKIQGFPRVLDSAHVPWLTDEFTERTLNFIFSHPRN